MKQRALKIMVVDDDEQRGLALADVLRQNGYAVTDLVSNEDDLLCLVMQTEPDVVLIDVTMPSRDTLEQLSTLHRNVPRPVVMFAQADDEETIEQAVRAGASVYLVDGLNRSRVRPVIDVAIAHFRQHQALRQELDEARTSLEDRKHIDRARGLLMERGNLSEQEAFAKLRRLAMDRKMKIGQVARDIVRTGRAHSPAPAKSAARDEELKP